MVAGASSHSRGWPPRQARIVGVLAMLLGLAAPARAEKPSVTQRIVRGAGAALGFGAGVAVTGALVFSKKWNAPLLKDGKAVNVRVLGRSEPLKVRHAPFLGPKIHAFAAKISTKTPIGRLEHGFVLGLGRGATAAPGFEGRLEGALRAAVGR
jgi:hypothetical protein